MKRFFSEDEFDRGGVILIALYAISVVGIVIGLLWKFL